MCKLRGPDGTERPGVLLGRHAAVLGRQPWVTPFGMGVRIENTEPRIAFTAQLYMDIGKPTILSKRI